MPRQFDVPGEVIKQVLKGELPPSAYSPYMSAIHEKHIIGVNSAFLIGNWIDIVFFGDKGWFLQNRGELAKFPGLKISCHPSGSKYKDERVKCMPRNKKYGKGISPNPSLVCWNGNSGAAAISVAVHTGVKRIILLGFDMKLGKNYKQHWHGLYGTADREEKDPNKLPFLRHMNGFPLIAKDAKKKGVEIINACPDSAIEQFKRVTVKEALSGKV